MSTTLNNLLFPVPDKILEPVAGRVLIANPLLSDYYFERSVVYIVEHNPNETIGIILNHPKKTTLNNVLRDKDKDHSLLNRVVSIGGPCSIEYLNILHTLPEINDSKLSKDVKNGLYWGGDLDKLKDLLMIKKLPAGSIRFFSGYSGWSPGQLENEIGQHNWVVAESNTKWNMSCPDVMWYKYVNRLGPSYSFWKQIPFEPQLN